MSLKAHFARGHSLDVTPGEVPTGGLVDSITGFTDFSAFGGDALRSQMVADTIPDGIEVDVFADGVRFRPPISPHVAHRIGDEILQFDALRSLQDLTTGVRPRRSCSGG